LSSIEDVDFVQNLQLDIQQPCQFEIHVEGAVENKDGLPKVYNRLLDKYKGQYDAVVFIHDDITINDCRVYQKLKKAFDKGMDVVGVAGGRGWMPPKEIDKPVGWNVASRECGTNGFIIHNEGDSTFATSFGPSPARTLTVDGCFIALMNKGLELRFDEQFDFNHYDIDLCFQAYKKGLAVGVEPIILTHSSIGKGLLKPEFLESQGKFLDKWFVRRK
jgi:hypothetical protein